VVRALAEHGRTVGIFYTWRRHPVVCKLRELAHGGALGWITSVELRMVTTQPRLRDPSHWLFRRDIASGGITSWLACHWLDAVRFITGEEVAAVSALTGTLSGEAIDVDDVSVVLFWLTGGALGTLHAGHLIAEGPAGCEGTIIYAQLIIRGAPGRAEYILAPGGEQVVVLHSVAPSWQANERQTFAFNLRPSPAYGGAYGEEFVRDCVRQGRQPGHHRRRAAGRRDPPCGLRVGRGRATG
jgi:predicted dehydrogenase